MCDLSAFDSISPGCSILQALRQVDSSDSQILVVLSSESTLLGVLTDGDIRRALISGLILTDTIDQIINYDFISAPVNTSDKELIGIMSLHQIKHIPIIDNDGRLVGIAYLPELIRRVARTTPIVIMAGGKGTRLRPLTYTCPKPMLDIAGKPMLEIIINQFVDFGFCNFYLSVNYLKEQIIEYFGDGSQFGINISYLIEDIPLGTAGSLSLLSPHIDEPIFVTNGDVLAKINPVHMLEFHHEHDAEATIAVRSYEHQVPFGVVTSNNNYLVAFKEKPIQSCLINTGIYIINPSVLRFLSESLPTDMPTLLGTCLVNRQKVSVYQVQSSWIDVGRPESLQYAIETWDH